MNKTPQTTLWGAIIIFVTVFSVSLLVISRGVRKWVQGTSAPTQKFKKTEPFKLSGFGLQAPAYAKIQFPGASSNPVPPLLNSGQITGLEQFLGKPFNSDLPAKLEDREITLVELSRSNGVRKLLMPILEWQESEPEKRRDVVLYVAPFDGSPDEEYQISMAVKSTLQEWGKLDPPPAGQISTLFHSRLKSRAYSLEDLLRFAHEKVWTTTHGLKRIPLEGPVVHIAWIRTTLTRWDLISHDGLKFNNQVIKKEQVTASLVDPARRTVTFIDLFTQHPSIITKKNDA